MKNALWLIILLFCWVSVASVKADDIDILSAAATQVDPNVLIIFDTSGSMAIEDIPLDPYQGHIDYADGRGYQKKAVYRWEHHSSGDSWVPLVDWEVLDQTCQKTGLAESLGVDGQAWGRINTRPPYDCGEQYDEIDLRTGNFLNYENSAAVIPMRSRLDTAKDVVKQIIDDHPDVRFGLMRFSESNGRSTNDTEGGRISDHGDINDHPTAEQLKADVDAFSAETYTPLAEALAEAGLYFAGERSWYNHLTYTSPIDVQCRSNFIILITDGESTRDQDPRLNQKNSYINNGTIGDFDGDGNENRVYGQGGSDYLDDVAAFLYENDLMPKMGSGDPIFEKQNIITHTIGFKHAHRLLKETAANGGGRYFTAGSMGGLARALGKILDGIEGSHPINVGPTVPASRLDGAYAGNFMYLPMFEPNRNTGLWRGNLKKYMLDPSGRLLDVNNRPAADVNGIFLSSAQSYWSEDADGGQVDAGGAGALLVNQTSRNLLTYIEADDKNRSPLLDAFSIRNKDNIPLTILGVASDAERQVVINSIHGVEREWAMGDVLHSKPALMHYDTNGDGQEDADDDALIFVGTNGGVMHAFWDSSGHEQWGFIPPGQLGRLKRLSDGINDHDYFLDGSPVAIAHGTDGLTQKTLVFGERRGGSTYYALDITDCDTPQWKYQIRESILGEAAEQLGQSWGSPQVVTLSTGSDGNAVALLLPGGYDTNQDALSPAAEDTRGRAVFSVVLENGSLGNFCFYNDGEDSDMTHCIVDLVGIDSDGDGITDSIYAPDLGGNIFAFTDSDGDGTWRKLRLFHASGDGMQRKIFYSPDVIRIAGDPVPGDNDPKIRVGEMIYFGTGDRAHPSERKVKNRFYAVKNYWWDQDAFTTMTDIIDDGGDGDLHNATQNLIVQGRAEERAAAEDEIDKRMGWFIDLESEGEKVVSSPVVYNKTVYFTTYVPRTKRAVGADDNCNQNADEEGIARLYGVDAEDGRAVHDNWSAVKEYLPESGAEIKSGGKADRYLQIGRSVPSAPKIVIRNGIAMLYVGVGGKLVAIAPKHAVEMNIYYWRELKP
ncbi:MAG: PilC/PilY family type IV pilus protein [Desulfobacteraceae bacterium]